MRLHARTTLVARARNELERTFFKIAEERGLTPLEMATIAYELQAFPLRAALRLERHPDDPDKKADEA